MPTSTDHMVHSNSQVEPLLQTMYQIIPQNNTKKNHSESEWDASNKY